MEFGIEKCTCIYFSSNCGTLIEWLVVTLMDQIFAVTMSNTVRPLVA
jgi:hypothetical protein